MWKSYLIAIVAGLVVSQLGWIDQLFIPLVLVGPPATGALAASKGVALGLVATAWASAGLGMLVSDELVNHEDVVFHAAITVVMVLLAAVGWSVVRLVRGRRVAS